MGERGSWPVAGRIRDTATAIRSDAAGIAAGSIVTAKTLTNFTGNLNWGAVDPTPYLYAGTRGVNRGLEEARLVWESLPEHLRALGPETVKARLRVLTGATLSPTAKAVLTKLQTGYLNWPV